MTETNLTKKSQNPSFDTKGKTSSWTTRGCMDVQVVKTTGRLYEISFYKYLATDMGWVRLLVLLDGTPVIGPNLKMECHGNKKEAPFDSDTQLKKIAGSLGMDDCF